MTNNKDYEKLDYLVTIYKTNKEETNRETNRETNQEQRKQALEELLTSLRPLIISISKHYFGTIDDDLIQDGYEETINLINKYDPSRTEVRFLGYIKRMLMCYYWGIRRRDLAKPPPPISLDQIGEIETKDNLSRLELIELLNTLTDKEKALIICVYLQGNNLKTAAQIQNISYAYSKELIAKAKSKLRKQISF